MSEGSSEVWRGELVTGGVGVWGGRGRNYALDGGASRAEALAAGRYRSGMTTALGWFMHKYAVGLYGVTPNGADLSGADLEDEAHAEAGAGPVAIAAEANGQGTLETYTVIYDRQQQPARALMYGRLDDGRRFVANSDGSAASFAALSGENQVGRQVRVRAAGGLNIAELAD